MPLKITPVHTTLLYFFKMTNKIIPDDFQKLDFYLLNIHLALPTRRLRSKRILLGCWSVNTLLPDIETIGLRLQGQMSIPIGWTLSCDTRFRSEILFVGTTHFIHKVIVYKVHIFWEGHKILRNLHRRFDQYILHRTNLRWRFRKILWPSQNIWTLYTLGVSPSLVSRWHEGYSFWSSWGP